MDILVIGPEPPCIRCTTTFKYAKQIAAQFPGRVEARKLTAHSIEADKIGKIYGGHEIADIEQVGHDHDGIERIMAEINSLLVNEEKNEGQIIEKLGQIQEKVSPVFNKAQEKGYLMTPVLVINGKIKAVGEVPSKEKMLQWVKEALGI